MGLRWDAKKEQFVAGGGKRGRPKGSRTVSADTSRALMPGEPEQKLLPEIVLSEEAPKEALIIAQIRNFLHGYPMTPILEAELVRKGLDVNEFKTKEKNEVAIHLHGIEDYLVEVLASRHEDMGNYVPRGTTASMGSVLPALSERNKGGNPRG